eukprot:1651643-Rhodomonas_salina.1
MPFASNTRNCIMSSTADVFFVSGAAIRRLSTAIAVYVCLVPRYARSTNRPQYHATSVQLHSVSTMSSYATVLYQTARGIASSG